MRNNQRDPKPQPQTPTTPADISPFKNGKNGRTPAGKFAPGNPGGPGRPRNALNQATQLFRALLEERTADLARKAIDDALAGKPLALKLGLHRLVLPPKDSGTSTLCSAPFTRSSISLGISQRR